MSVLFYTHPVALRHDAGPGHPESPLRLQAILAAVEAAAIPGLERLEAPLATLEQVQRVHPARYTSRILAAVPSAGYARVDADTVLQPVLGRGGVAGGGGRLRRGRCRHGRPDQAGVLRHAPARPSCRGHGGHGLLPLRHRRGGGAAGAGRARAVAAGDPRFRRASRQRHAGDLLRRPDTLYASTHQSPLYPGTGHLSERGIKGNILNRPLPPGTGSEAWRRVVERDVLPAIDCGGRR